MDYPFKSGKLKSVDAIKKRLKKSGIPISKNGAGRSRIYNYPIKNCALSLVYDLETKIYITQHDLWAARIPERNLQKILKESLGSPAYSTGPSPKNSYLNYTQQYMYDFINRNKEKERVIIKVVSC